MKKEKANQPSSRHLNARYCLLAGDILPVNRQQCIFFGPFLLNHIVSGLGKCDADSLMERDKA